MAAKSYLETVVLYRIFTEDINQETIETIIAPMFPDFTMYPATGYWKGRKERSLIIEIEACSKDAHKIERVALKIKEINGQMAVMLQKIRNFAKLL